MLKSKAITLPIKIHIVKAMVFPVVMCGCESWTVKKAEPRRTDTFKLWCWRKLLRVPWMARRPNQSIQRKSTVHIQWKNWCWSWSSNTLATWWEEVTHWKRPNPRKHWRQKEKGTTEDKMVGWHHRLNRHEFEQALGVDDGQGSHMCCNPWVTKSQTWLRDWKTTNVTQFYIPISNI